MPESKTPLAEQLENLRRTRDELLLHVHLGAEDARDEWERAEVLWHRLQGEAQRFGEASKRPSKQLKTATATLVHELGHAYTRVLAALKRPV